MNIRGIIHSATVLCTATLVLLAAAPAFADLADPADAWHVTELRLTEAHRISRGGGVTVALLGDGVDAHRDLTGALLPAVQIAAPSTSEHRGTHAAGVIAARGNGTKGLLGIAPQAMILPVNVGADAKARDGAALVLTLIAVVLVVKAVRRRPSPVRQPGLRP